MAQITVSDTGKSTKGMADYVRTMQKLARVPLGPRHSGPVSATGSRRKALGLHIALKANTHIQVHEGPSEVSYTCDGTPYAYWYRHRPTVARPKLSKVKPPKDQSVVWLVTTNVASTLHVSTLASADLSELKGGALHVSRLYTTVKASLHSLCRTDTHAMGHSLCHAML